MTATPKRTTTISRRIGRSIKAFYYGAATVDWRGAGRWVYLRSVSKKRDLRRSASKLVTKEADREIT